MKMETKMKTNAITGTLLMSLVVLAGCKDDDIMGDGIPWKPGEKIVFGVRAGYENNAEQTRTYYTGKTYNYDGKTYERIHWVKDKDSITIHCPQASKMQLSNYIVTDRNFHPGEGSGHDLDYAFLMNETEEGLRWGEPGNHDFYAIYPKVNGTTCQYDPETHTLTGTIPTSQTPNGGIETRTGKTENGTKAPDTIIVKPNMERLFMWAKTTVNSNTGNEVNLTFQPITTALELQLKNKAYKETDSLELLNIRIRSDNHKSLTGKFSCSLSAELGTDGYPVCTQITGTSTATENDTQGRETTASEWVTVSLTAANNSRPLKIGPQQVLKVTVFMLPSEPKFDNLRLTIQSTKSIRTLNLNRTLSGITENDQTIVEVIAHKKNYITNLSLPIDAWGNNWISLLPDNALVKNLSIPGSGNSFSAAYTGSNKEYFRSQTDSFGNQWNAGVRCFELVSDRMEDSIYWLQDKTDERNLGQALLECGGNTIQKGLTIMKAYKQIVDSVKANPKEFAMVIFHYQPKSNRDVEHYAHQLKVFMKSIKQEGVGDTIRYTRSRTVSEVRGKIMIFARILGNSTEDQEKDIAKEKGIVYFDGWSTDKDRWKDRGYSYPNLWTKPNLSTDNNSFDQGSYMENKVLIAKGNSNNNSIPAQPSNTNFIYTYMGKQRTVWIQEWERVALQEIIQHKSILTQSYTIKWFPSYNEKLDNVKETIHAAIEDKGSCALYINSLCGYAIDKDYEPSYLPYRMGSSNWTGGGGGNIQALATKLNQDTYEHILQNGIDNITGPLGIVIMNYAARKDGVLGSRLLPAIIVANNFKFGLDHDPGASTAKE